MTHPLPQPETGLAPGLKSFAGIGRIAARGPTLATLISMFAFAFSAVSFYETVMKTPQLAAFVPPVIQYARDGGGDTELFAIPVTISNDGARTGTVLAMELEAENLKTKSKKRYYSAFFGDHPKNADTTNRSFGPLSIAGRASFTDTIRFYPIGNPLPKLVDDAGDYRFTLHLKTAAPESPGLFDRLWRAEPQPLTFERTLPWISNQQLGFRRAISMTDRAWNPKPDEAPKAGEAPAEAK